MADDKKPAGEQRYVIVPEAAYHAALDAIRRDAQGLISNQPGPQERLSAARRIDAAAGNLATAAAPYVSAEGAEPAEAEKSAPKNGRSAAKNGKSEKPDEDAADAASGERGTAGAGE